MKVRATPNELSVLLRGHTLHATDIDGAIGKAYPAEVNRQLGRILIWQQRFNDYRRERGWPKTRTTPL